MAPPVFGSAGTYYFPNAAGTSAAIPVPAGVAAGHIILVHLYLEHSNAVTAPTGFTEVGTPPSTTGNVQYHRVFWKRATGADSGSYTFSWTTSTWRAGVATRYTSVVASGSPIDVFNTAARSTSGTVTPPVAVTTTGPERLLVWAGSVWDNSTWTPPSGYTERVDGQLQGVATRDWLTAGATGNVTGTSTASNTQTAWLIALLPAQTAESVTADDTGTGTDPITVVDILPAVDDTGAGTDTVTATDADSATVTDTGAGSDTVTTADADNADVADTAAGVDQLTLDELLDLADTGAGTDPVTVSDILPDTGDTGAGRDDVTALDIPFTQLLPHRPGPTYELVVVARIPAETGPPTLIEVDPIRWTSLRYTDELSKPQQLEASCLISTLPESITRRMEGDPNTELLLLRNGRPVFAGPLVGWRATDGDTLTVTAHGLLAYLQRMVVDTDRVFRQVDQFQIVAALIDGWQNSPFGHYGIDTSSAGASGQLRDGTYLRDELHKVGQRVEEMGARINGYDIEVDPQSRRLQLWNPEQGVDRSDGEDAIVFDRRHITSGDVLCSFGPDDLASDGFGNSNTTDGNTLWATRHNAELRAKYGRSAVAGSWSNIERQDTLDDHVQALVDSRGRPLLVPGPNLRVTVDADLDDYGVGDTVRYEVHERLGVAGAFRIRRRTVSVAAPSQEQVSLEFV